MRTVLQATVTLKSRRSYNIIEAFKVVYICFCKYV